MRPSTLFALLAASSVCIAAVGLWGFYQSFDPVPTELQSFTGTAREVRTSTILYTRSHATFQLKQMNGELLQFSYTPSFRRFHYFAEHLKEGQPVEVTIGPDGKHDIWGLKLGTETLMSPTEAREARLQGGWWGVALFLGFFGSFVWAARQASKLRNRGT